MKLISYFEKNGGEQLAALVDGLVFDLPDLNKDLRSRMDLFLRFWNTQYPLALEAVRGLREGKNLPLQGKRMEEMNLLSPVPRPGSCRDGYAFRQHVETARRNRGLKMIPQFDQYPVFYFTNHRTVRGPGKLRLMPDHFERLDFELEVAAVICRRGKNIKAAVADRFIGGLMIMNDLSARTLQMEEMMLNLGPAKGKDFATSLGPWLVTPEELRPFEAPCKPGHVGKSWDLQMRARINGVQVSAGNLKDMDWTFAEIIERASYGVELFPGDVIGSGTVGTGCFLELNGTAKLADPSCPERWLQEGDEIELTVDGLGSLVNTVEMERSEHSLLGLKKEKHI